MNTAVVLRMMLAFLAETALDALVIMMAVRVLRVRIRPLRVLFAAFFGASAAFAAKYAGLSQRSTALLWLPLALVMMRLSGGCGRGMRSAARGALALLACAGFLGGTVLALHGATGSLPAAYAVSAVFAAAVFVGVLRASRSTRDVQRVRVVCVIGGRQLTLDAIADSGNSLRDYLTHRPVIVAGSAHAKALSGVSMRPIFADTAGGRQMMQLAMPERTVLCLADGQIAVEATLAFSAGLGGDAPALVPAALLLEKDEGD